MTEFVWLRHELVADAFRCPAAAVEGWKSRGWYESEAPPEVNLALAEWAPPEPKAVQAEAEAESAPDSEPTKTKPRRPAANDSTEGVSS